MRYFHIDIAYFLRFVNRTVTSQSSASFNFLIYLKHFSISSICILDIHFDALSVRAENLFIYSYVCRPSEFHIGITGASQT